MKTVRQESWFQEHFEKLATICGFPGGSEVKASACIAGDAGDSVLSLGQEDLLEEGTKTHSSILAWRIPWTEEASGL